MERYKKKKNTQPCLCMDCQHYSSYINPYSEERESYCNEKKEAVRPDDYKCIRFKIKRRIR